MDGTLIDTEKYYRVCWPKALADFGYYMTDEMALQCRSLGAPFAEEQFRTWFGSDFDYLKVRSHRRELVSDMVAENGIQLKTGAKEILEFLKERSIPAAVCTANDIDRANRLLKTIGLDGYFGSVISAKQAERGKPAPDPYLLACRMIGKEPSLCAAVEDSPNGIISAYEAGCLPIMIPDQTEPDEKLSGMLYARLNTLGEIRNLKELLA